jgi:hypothetical protein
MAASSITAARGRARHASTWAQGNPVRGQPGYRAPDIGYPALDLVRHRGLSHPARCSWKLAVAGAVVLLCDLVSTTQVLWPSALQT